MYWYISFATENQFLGATIVNADDPISAVQETVRLGINPGGQVLLGEIPDELFRDNLTLSKRMVNKLYSYEDMVREGMEPVKMNVDEDGSVVPVSMH